LEDRHDAQAHQGIGRAEENDPTKRRSEPKPADSPRNKFNVIGDWLPALTFSLVAFANTIMKRLLYAFSILLTLVVHAEWTPPPKPDPQRILNEAESDADAGRYEDALAKHVWFHQNALKHRPSLYGVRLSFALSAWAKLGAAYPPALAKLKSIRDEAAKNVREADGNREAFHDFASINETLQDDSKTKDLFVWLDSNKPSVAKKVFDLAQPALIKAKEYHLCGGYIEADTSFHRILDLYRENKRIAQDPKFGKKMQEFGEKSFANGTATLVALLVVNGRKADADRIAVEALTEWDDPKFKKQIEKAKHGDVPAPWP
jgi:hypothetical protein